MVFLPFFNNPCQLDSVKKQVLLLTVILLKTVLDNSLALTETADTTYFFADLITAVHFTIFQLYSFLPPDIIVDTMTAPSLSQWKITNAALDQLTWEMTAITQVLPVLLSSQALAGFHSTHPSLYLIGKAMQSGVLKTPCTPCNTVVTATEWGKHYFSIA